MALWDHGLNTSGVLRLLYTFNYEDMTLPTVLNPCCKIQNLSKLSSYIFLKYGTSMHIPFLHRFAILVTFQKAAQPVLKANGRGAPKHLSQRPPCKGGLVVGHGLGGQKTASDRQICKTFKWILKRHYNNPGSFLMFIACEHVWTGVNICELCLELCRKLFVKRTTKPPREWSR